MPLPNLTDYHCQQDNPLDLKLLGTFIAEGGFGSVYSFDAKPQNWPEALKLERVSEPFVVKRSCGTQSLSEAKREAEVHSSLNSKSAVNAVKCYASSGDGTDCSNSNSYIDQFLEKC